MINGGEVLSHIKISKDMREKGLKRAVLQKAGIMPFRAWSQVPVGSMN